MALLTVSLIMSRNLLPLWTSPVRILYRESNAFSAFIGDGFRYMKDWELNKILIIRY